MTKRIGLYLRVSTEKQKLYGWSLEQQEEELKQKAELQGKQVVGIYKDDGYSGGRFDRPALLSLLYDAKCKLFDEVWTRDVSRLSRNQSHLLTILQVFEENSIDYYSLDQKQNFETPIGKMLIQIMGSIAEFQREVAKENQIANQKQLAYSGRYVAGSILGYEWGVDSNGRKNLIVNETEADLVLRIFNLYAEGKGKKKISSILNDEGIKTKRGKLFGVHTINCILKDVTYIGKLKYKGEILDASHPAIVSEELWGKVHQKLALCKWHGKDMKLHLLSSILKCPHCGGGMSFQLNRHTNGRNTPWYLCSNYLAYGVGRFKRGGIRADKAEKLVMDFLVNYLKNDTWKNSVVEELKRKISASSSVNIKELKQKKKKLLHQVERIVSAYENNRLDLIGFLAQNDVLKKELQEIETQITKVEETEKAIVDVKKIEDAFNHLGNVLSSATDEERYQLVRNVVKSINVGENQEIVSIEVLPILSDKEASPLVFVYVGKEGNQWQKI